MALKIIRRAAHARVRRLQGSVLGILEAPRQVSSEWHIVQAKKLLEFDAGRQLDTVLVYAAVELRAAIERTFFELLYLLKEQQISDADVRRCRSLNGLAALLAEADRAYRKTMQFTSLVASLTPGLPAVAVIDTAYLLRRWKDLSEYCHLQFKPADSFDSPNRTFQRRGFAILDELLGKFLEWHVNQRFGLLARSSLSDEVRSVYDKFVAGTIDEDQARRMLEIAEPILRRRDDLQA